MMSFLVCVVRGSEGDPWTMIGFDCETSLVVDSERRGPPSRDIVRSPTLTIFF